MYKVWSKLGIDSGGARRGAPCLLIEAGKKFPYPTSRSSSSFTLAIPTPDNARVVVVDSRTGKKISIPHLQEHLMWSCYVGLQAVQHNAFLEPNLAHNNVITIDTTIDTHPP